MARDLLDTGLAWLTARLQADASSPVTYQRGADSVAVRATFGRKLFKLADDAGGVRMEWTDRDFLIPFASLSAFGLPRRGDRVRVPLDDGSVLVYEVLAPGGEAPWTWSDPFRRTIRIHAKHVATETP